MENYFIFNNKSSEEFNIVIEDEGMSPITNSQNETETIEVPGRDGVLTIDTGRRKQIIKSITCILLDEGRKSEVRRWLKNNGHLTLSNEDDVFYKAKIKSSINFKDHWNGGWSFEIEFECFPYGYLHNGDGVIEITEKNTVLYNYEEKSKPILRIFGSGEIDLTINNKIHKFTINQYIEVDSELMESYKENLPVRFTGDFPELVTGENNFTWLGSVTKIEVIPRWRR